MLLSVSLTTRRAHPRSRGENAVQIVEDGAGAGSSPLTRGKPDRGASINERERLIPAHAGKTPSVVLPGDRVRAHPRSRGENASSMPRARLIPGSSPLTRGKPRMGCRRRAGVRLIPAHAGKTRSPSQTPRTPRAHPRSRGENKHYTRGQFTITGSSPLTRGKHLLLEGAHVVYGLIPAHAGKTVPPGPSTRAAWAHPRSRGENP